MNDIIDFESIKGQPDILRGEDTPYRRARRASYYYRGDVIPTATYARLAQAVVETDDWFSQKHIRHDRFKNMAMWCMGIIMAAVMAVLGSFYRDNEYTGFVMAGSIVLLAMMIVWGTTLRKRNSAMKHPELSLLDDPLDRAIAHAARVDLNGYNAAVSDPADDVYRDPDNPHFGNYYQGSMLTDQVRQLLQETVTQPWQPFMESVKYKSLKKSMTTAKRTIWLFSLGMSVMVTLFVTTSPINAIAVLAVTGMVTHFGVQTLTRVLLAIYPSTSHMPPELYFASLERIQIRTIQQAYVPDLRYRVIEAATAYREGTRSRRAYQNIKSKLGR